MRTLLALTLAVVATLVSASAICDMFNANARYGVLSYNENKVFVRKTIQKAVKKHKSRFGAQTMMLFPMFNLFAAPFINVPLLSQMPANWVALPGVGPYSMSMPTPRYFKANGQPALTCQFDCLSKISGKAAYTKCGTRYYTYAALQMTEGCFSRTAINDQQAALVNQICTSYNKCVGSNWAVTKENIAQSTGDNTGFIAPLSLSD